MSGATFYLYVRGEDWLSENDPTLLARFNSNRAKAKGANEENPMTSVTPSTIVTDDSLHKISSNFKRQLSISINRFVHRHPQQVN